VRIKLETPAGNARRIDDKIIPMINIIFLLLMFFLIAGNISKLVSEEVVPPRSGSATVTTAAGTDWILARNGTLILRGREMTRQQLASWLAEPGNTPPDRIVLRADAGARSGALIPVMKLLREHGVEKVSLVTINDDGMH
jgi:biopolymer transport protein ExbD